MEYQISRRRFFEMSSAALAIASLPTSAVQAKRRRSGFTPGLQLYTLQKEALADLDGTLNAVAQIGFQKVELAGLLGRTAAQFKASLDKANLRCTSIHLPALPPAAGGLSLSDDPGTLAAALHMIGCTTAVLPLYLLPANAPGPKEGESGLHYIQRVSLAMTTSDWLRTADFLNKAGRALKQHGIALGYHNHNPEFAPTDGGQTGFDILIGNTDPDAVHIELDVGWTSAAGVHPVAFLKKHATRIRQLHLKDISASTQPNFAFQQEPRALGDGKTNWQALISAAVDARVQDFFVEQEPRYPTDALTQTTRSFKYLAKNFSLKP